MFELDDETRWILGRPNFWCGGLARTLRKMGHQINERAEDEQAAVIYWMLTLYMQYGDKWREEGAALIKSVIYPIGQDVMPKAPPTHST
jgi:hypothetical protein